ncbi:hypothetical protein F4561_000089 [Lipingzhangella halophila]|uniref:Uncharacterized protein n=1 Tax=Lipingzhangella halophila TaxID=1783352 RepID=A0A7W7RC83_9ACTN|nr:hypothetical protein [Lipingzhangella halophila]MBB4929269.1 hypothetical protein [Lipingzhangella halophila]
MSERNPRTPEWVQVLLAPFAALLFLLVQPGPPPRHARTLARQKPPAPSERLARLLRHTQRPHPYALSTPTPVAIPQYERFCQVHSRNRARWRLTYEPDQFAPYQAHHRVLEGIVLAANDLEALDLALTEFAPPPHTRPYLDHRDGSLRSATAERTPARVL